MSAQKWSEITREERFFTSTLYHDIVKCPQLFWELLAPKLNLPNNTRIIDEGYEVCFFRDAYLAGLLKERVQRLEKQTFDLVLWLDTGEMIIIEAKAQQGFLNKQLDELENARCIIRRQLGRKCPEVHLVGLCSSKYNPSECTKDRFDSIVLWPDVANQYQENQRHYYRADKIYRDVHQSLRQLLDRG